jgi:hypothetical protein
MLAKIVNDNAENQISPTGRPPAIQPVPIRDYSVPFRDCSNSETQLSEWNGSLDSIMAD